MSKPRECYVRGAVFDRGNTNYSQGMHYCKPKLNHLDKHLEDGFWVPVIEKSPFDRLTLILNLIEKNQYKNGEELGLNGMRSLACNALAEVGYYVNNEETRK